MSASERRKEGKGKKKRKEKNGKKGASKWSRLGFLLLQALAGAEPTALYKTEMGGPRNPYLPKPSALRSPKQN